MKLNIQKINIELDRLGKNKKWIADQLKTDRQKVNYWFRSATIKAAEPIGQVLGIDPRDLITSK